MELGAGTLIGGRYRLERLLGRGGMGEVWAAKHTVTRRDVALKFLNVEQGTMPQMRRRFVREARAASAVAHPNVIQIHDVFELEDETPVMVMDLLTGESLGDKLAREGAIDVEETARILAPVVSAVGTAHAVGIVHRDLKPENIFLARGGGEIEVKVLDFGIAKFGHSLELDQTGAVTGTGAVLGTPYYMALEQAYGEKDIDHRADIWSLGVVLYECLAGRRPVEGDNFGQIVKFLNQGTIPPLTQIAPHVPADLCALVGRMLQRAREERPQDLREVLAVLRRYTGAAARTFGGPRAPHTTGADDGAKVVSSTVPAAPGLELSSAGRGVDPNVVTIEVATAERPPDVTQASAPSPPLAPSERKSVPVDVVTPSAPRVPSADVTLAESASAVPARAPSPPSRRTALIAGVCIAAGVAATAAVVLTMSPRSRVSPTPGGSTPVVATPAPPKVDAPTVPATAPTSTAAPAGSAAPADPTPADPAPSTSASALKPPRPGPLGSAKPAASGTPSAKPAASAPAPPPDKPKGGLVEAPPF